MHVCSPSWKRSFFLGCSCAFQIIGEIVIVVHHHRGKQILFQQLAVHDPLRPSPLRSLKTIVYGVQSLFRMIHEGSDSLISFNAVCAQPWPLCRRHPPPQPENTDRCSFWIKPEKSSVIISTLAVRACCCVEQWLPCTRSVWCTPVKLFSTWIDIFFVHSNRAAPDTVRT